MVGDVAIGGGAPIVVQSMTNTDTADAAATASQILELARAGSELVRVTVPTPEAAAAVTEIRARLDDAGCAVPIIGDLHFNGHVLLHDHPGCARNLAKYRINPGTVRSRRAATDPFAAICRIALDHGKPVRIGVNGGSLDGDLVTERMAINASSAATRSTDEILEECMVVSALESADHALQLGLSPEQIVLSCKVSRPPALIRVSRELAARTAQPLHLGLTEAGSALRGLVWSVAALAPLLADGIGDTIRISLTPRPGGDRCDEVRACRALLQAIGLRSFAPSVTSCPGCGRTTATVFQELAERVERHLEGSMPRWTHLEPEVRDLQVAVMGCIVNGPGESRSADVGISLPGTGEAPSCPVFVDGRQLTTLRGAIDELARDFTAIIDDYVNQRWGRDRG
jgi:(E)-4-hydroxy-3-methylbut-2-enyl-diphosphate synthase